MDYKAYGAAVQNQTKAETSGYTGHYEDPLTGLTYMQARYYDADLGRFMSPDPAAVRPGDLLNFGRYAYASANPVNYVDPDGREAEEADKANAKTLDQVVVHGSGGGSSGGMPSFVGTSGSRGGGEPGGGAPTLETVKVTADDSAEPEDPIRIFFPDWIPLPKGSPFCTKTAASIAGATVGGAVTGGLTGAANGKNPAAIVGGAVIGGVFSGVLRPLQVL